MVRGLSKSETMRSAFLVLLLAAVLSLSAAPPLAQPESGPTSTVPPAAADAGKDVVHQLNSAFTKVFEIVAPTVVIIEVTKKNDGPDTSALDDLFFQQPQDESAPRRSPPPFLPATGGGAPPPPRPARAGADSKRRLGLHRPGRRIHLHEL